MTALGRGARVLSAALALFFFLSSIASAQTTTATIKGTVRTEGRQTVADATVRARSDATGTVRSALTDASGKYRIDLLAPGAWTVVASVPGGGTSSPRAVTLGLQQSVDLDFTVSASMTEEVTVKAEAPLIDRRQVGGSLRVGSQSINALPIIGRAVTDLALLDSSAKAPPPGGFYGERGAVFTLNGQSGRANSFLVDGVDNNDAVSGTTMNSSFSQQVIREFVVLTHQFAPEFGRASGGVLNIITQRGDNDFAGQVFLQGASSHWNTGGEFIESLPNPEDLPDATGRSMAGLSFGGPLKKDRAFYFFAYEHQRADEVTPFTGVGRDGTAGGWVLAPTQGDNLFFRTDWNLSASNFLMVRLSGDRRTTSDMIVGGVTTPEAGFGLEENDAQLAATLTTVISENLFSEARLLISGSEFDQTANSNRPGVSHPSGEFGGNNLNHQLRQERVIQGIENLTWRTGPQTFKFGIDVATSKTDVDVRFNPGGNFIYNTDIAFEPGDCGDLNNSDFSSDPAERRRQERNGVYCSGDPNGIDNDGDGTVDEKGILDSYPAVYVLVDGQPRVTIDDTRIALFAQSSWQVSSKLLIDYGLRYDLSTYVLPQDAGVPSSIPNGGASRDENNIAPRVGFSWTPGEDGRFVLRGGAGIFYDKLVLAFPALASISSGTRIGLFFPEGFTVEWNEQVVEEIIEEQGHDAIEREIFFLPQLTLRFSTGTSLDTPYTVQYTLGAEQATGEHGVFRASAERALGYHLVLMRDLNPPLRKSAQGIPEHRDPNVGSIAAVVTEGRSWYSGVDLGWRWQKGAHAYSFGYTWSEAEDLGPDPLKGGLYLPAGRRLLPSSAPYPPPEVEPHGEKGRADSDRRHRFVATCQTELPIFGGLGISGVAQYATGLPFNVTTGQDNNLDGILSDRPVGIGRNTGSGSPLAPINALRRKEGLPAISSLDEPYFAQVDLRLWKRLAFGEAGRVTSDIFLQVFNVFDRFNGGPVEGRVTSRDFGEPIGLAGPPRTLEVGFKVGF